MQQSTNGFSTVRDKYLFPIMVGASLLVLGAASSAWYNAANSVPKERYYQDMAALEKRLTAIETKLDLLRERIPVWETTLQDAVEELRNSRQSRRQGTGNER